MTTETHNGEADAGYWKTQHAVLLAAFERRTALLREALPFIDTNPDLHRDGGDELSERIAAELNSPEKSAP